MGKIPFRSDPVPAAPADVRPDTGRPQFYLYP
jgi:hypothetical protein